MLTIGRRAFLLSALGLLASVLLCASPVPSRAAQKFPPIVFVHGNGDSASLWIAQIWRFESNGYPAARLFAVNLKYPLARAADAVPQEGRSSTAEQMKQLADFVDGVLSGTGAAKVVLVGNSRGANTIRNYVKNGGGAGKVSHVVLGGGVNHGVLVSEKALIGSEFNGASAFMKQLNDGPDEVVPGVAFLTLRSDHNDKYAQADGRYIGLPGVATGLGYDAPALKGATNLVLPGADHRETAYGAAAFAAMYKFITGHAPKRNTIAAQPKPVLNGTVTGITGGFYDNLPVKGATVEIWHVDPKTGQRQAKPAYTKVTGDDGVWGPFTARSNAYYEFVIQAPGQPITHIYRSPFLRSTRVLDLRPGRLAKGDEAAGSVVIMSRPRGYFGVGRDKMLFDGKPPAGLPEGVPAMSMARVVLPASPQRAVVATFDGETIAARNWPAAEKQISIVEFTY